MGVKTVVRPESPVGQDESVDSPALKKAKAFIDWYIDSGIPTVYEFKTSERGNAVIPSDWPAELVEAWDGENVRKV
jgi:hypothetical protein